MVPTNQAAPLRLDSLDQALQRVALGDAGAFGDIVYMTLSDVYRFACRLLADQSAAEAMLPRAYNRLTEAAHLGESGGVISPFLMLYRNVFLFSLDALKACPVALCQAPEDEARSAPPAPAPSPAQVAMMDLSKWLASLSPWGRATWVMRMLEGRNVEEMAQILGCGAEEVQSTATRTQTIFEHAFGYEAPGRIESWRKATAALTPPHGLKVRLKLSRSVARLVGGTDRWIPRE